MQAMHTRTRSHKHLRRKWTTHVALGTGMFKADLPYTCTHARCYRTSWVGGEVGGMFTVHTCEWVLKKPSCSQQHLAEGWQRGWRRVKKDLFCQKITKQMLSNIHSQKTQPAQCFPRGCDEDRVCRHMRSGAKKIGRMSISYQTCREDIYNDNAPGTVSVEICYRNLQQGGCFCGFGFRL